MVTTKVGSTGGFKEKRPLRVAVSAVKGKKQPRAKNPKVAIDQATISNTKSKLVKSKKNVIQKRSSTLEKKLENVSQLHERKSSKVKKENEKLILPQIRPKAALALLSPYRFPMPAQTIAVATARVGGLFFVITGAIFTLFFANNFFGVYALEAQVISSQNTFENIQPITTIVTSPLLQEVSFEVNNPTELRDSVQVKIRVKDAQKVTLAAYYKTQGKEVTLGRPVKISADTWEFYWDTTAFDDGAYKLKAIVNNGYETYERVDSSYVTVQNTAITETTALITSHLKYEDDAVVDMWADELALDEFSTTYDDALTEEEVPDEVYLYVDTDVSSTEFRFEIDVYDADKVKLYARAPGATKSTLIGYAYKADNTSWRYRWLVSALQQGEYEVRATALIGTREYTSESMLVTVGVIDDYEYQKIIDETTLDTPLDPSIILSILKSSPLSGAVDVRIDVEGATAIEMYSLPRYTLTKRYLGEARHVDKGTWIFSWDTKLVPNGEYQVVAEVNNAYGLYSQKSNFVKVSNQYLPKLTEEEQLKIETLSKVAEEVERALIDAFKSEASDSAMITEEKKLGAEVLAIANEETKFNELIASFKNEIDAHLQILSVALRMSSPYDIERAIKRLETLKNEIIDSSLSDIDRQKFVERIDSYMAISIQRVEKDVENTNKLIVERTGENAILDSDNDGISDYDEVNIYNTNPFSADTDSDGFTDGAEILSGYNPNDASPEALVVYESPKEWGIVREDILVVESVITAVKNDEEVTKPTAIISGKALPNSFVSLYIFSTPIVVTVKTDADGSWNYRFDKEIEDGEHQVYIGVTDNAGKIIAKSNPFTFIKKAEAFTGVTQATQASATSVPASSESLVSRYMVYLVLSISVVAIGLLLMLLGFHLNTRQRKPLTADEVAQVAV